MIAKGNTVTVRGENGSGIHCTVVDSNARSVWVRLPTNTVVKLQQNPRTGLLEGRAGSLELTVNLREN
jgi:preprotein translocase subunit YajC